MLLLTMICTVKCNYWSIFYINCTLFLYLIVLILGLPGIHPSGTFTVSGPLVQPILPLMGEDVLLSCYLSPKMDARGMTIKWVSGPFVVFLYHWGQEREDVLAPQFQGRTKMLRQDMAEGKVTVIIHQVQLSDSGQYTCYFQAGTFCNESSSDLQVAERQRGAFSATGSSQPIQVKQGEDVTLSCELSPKMDAQNISVKWFRNRTLVHSFPNEEKLEEFQGAEFQGRTELLTPDMAEGKVTLRIQQVQVSDSGLYTCYVRSPENYDEAHIELQVADHLPTSQPLRERIYALIPLLISALLVTAFFFQRKLQGIRGNENELKRKMASRTRIFDNKTPNESWKVHITENE